MNYFFLLKQIYWIVPLSFKQIFLLIQYLIMYITSKYYKNQYK